MKTAKDIHSITTALLMWSASALLQIMAAAGLVRAGMHMIWPPHQTIDMHPVVSTVLASLALIELAWMSATWAMEHALRLPYLLDVCLIFIAREIIDRLYTDQLSLDSALVIGGVFMILMVGRWMTPKVYQV